MGRAATPWIPAAAYLIGEVSLDAHDFVHVLQDVVDDCAVGIFDRLEDRGALQQRRPEPEQGEHRREENL